MKRNFTRLFLSAVLMMCCMSVWAGGDWTIIEQPTCSTYGTMQNPANTSELRLVPKLAHQFGDDGKCTVCNHAAPVKYNGTPAESLVTITESNYAKYGLTEMNKGCVMGWTVISTAEEFMKYMNSRYYWIEFNAFLAEDIILNDTENLPERRLEEGYVFDGTGHTISNMYRSGDGYVGLYFRNHGTIRNLGLISPKIVVSDCYAGCICGDNWGTIENCFVIDGYIEGTDSDLYGIASQSQSAVLNKGGKIINCYAISNVGNIGNYTVTNSYAATTGNVPDNFYANTLDGLNANKVNGITWRADALHSIPCMMMPSIGYYPERPASCTEGEIKAHWYCTVCGKYFLDACHSQEAPIGAALGHDMKHITKVEATCVETGIKEHYHCDRCGKDFEDENGTNEIDPVIPFNPQNHPSKLQYFDEVKATCAKEGCIEHYHCDQCKKDFDDENGTNEINAVIPINPNDHNLSLEDGKAHCDQCDQDFSDFVATNDKPVLLTKEDEKYYLEASDGFTLQDGVNYLAPVDFIVNGTFTYRRNVSGAKAGAWQCWYEPFYLELTEYVLEKMDVAEVAGVLIDNEGNTVVAFRKIDTGWMKANTPYVFRPKDAILTTGNLELKMTGPQLYSSAETTFYNMSTYDKFTFGGNYTARHNDSWYTLNTSGVFQTMKEGVNLKGQRFWMTVEARDDIPYERGGIADAKEFIDFTVLGDNESTGIESLTTALSEGKGVIYDLMGRKVTSIQSGQVYIMNGKKYIAR